MAGYVRQSTADIIPTATVRAAPLNAEYNAIRDAFAASGGHRHDGTAAEGDYVPLISDLDNYNKVVIDSTNNRVGVFVEVSAAAVEQVRFQDGAIVPVTTNDIDLGTSSLKFKNLYIEGTATIGDVSLAGGTIDDTAIGATTPAAGTFTTLTATTVDLNGGNIDGTVIGATTAAAADFTTMDASGNATVGGTFGVTGNTTVGGTLGVTGVTTLGTANITSVDLDSGAIDNTTIGAATPAAGTFTVLTANTSLTAATADINGGTLDGVTIGGTVSAAATVTDLTATGTSTLSTVDINAGAIDGTTIGATSHTTGKFTTLQSTGLATLNSVNIDGGNIDGTIIGAATPAAITGTTITGTSFVGPVTGNVTGNLTGNVTGDLTGDVTGNITSSGSSTFNNVTIDGTLNMNAGTTATITNLTSPTNTNDAATKGYVDTSISNLVDSAPGTLDTLNELAAALGDDPNFSTTITNSIATKLPLAGGTMTGAIAMSTNKITGLGDPTAAQDAMTKAYADSNYLALSGGTMTGAIDMGSAKITTTYTPTNAADLTTKTYVDGILGSATAAAASAAAAATSETNAATSETNAATSATNAANDRTTVQNIYDQFDDRYLGAKASAPTVDNDGDALVTGALYFNTTTNIMNVYGSGGWQSAGSAVNGTSDRQTYTATAGQTVFAATYDAGYVDVYLNGVKLLAGTDFTATNGTSITLASGAALNDIVDIVAYGTFVLADHLTETQSDAKYVELAGDTMTGDLQISQGASSPSQINFTTNGQASRYSRIKVDTDRSLILTAGVGSVNETPDIKLQTGTSTGEKDRLLIDGATGDISFYEDTGTTAKFFWDASEELLSVGDLSGDSINIRHGSNVPRTSFYHGGTFKGEIGYRGATAPARQNIMEMTTQGSDPIAFRTNGSEAARFDASGNFLVGNTTTGLSSAGINLHNNGTFELRRDLGSTNSSTVGYISRGSTDGNILQFYKDTTHVGSIGTQGGEFTIGQGDTGIKFHEGVDAILPWNTSASNTNRDAAIDLGNSTNRFAESYFSSALSINPSSNGYAQINLGDPSQTQGGPHGIKFYTQNGASGDHAALQFRTGDNTFNFENTAAQQSIKLYPFTGQAVFNNTNNNTGDFQVKSANNNHMLFVDALTNRVGIGEDVPDTLVHAKSSTARFTLESTAADEASIAFITPSGNSYMGQAGANGELVTSSSAGDFVISNRSGGDIHFSADTAYATAQLSIEEGGKILANTTGLLSNHSSGRVQIDGGSQHGLSVITGASSGFAAISCGRNSSGAAVEFHYTNSTNVGKINIDSNSTTYVTNSDRRLKDNIAAITNGTEKLMAMNPVTHTWVNDPSADAVHGFIAQEMQEIVPEAVSGDPDSQDMMSMDYGRITPVIVAALQDAHRKIEALEERLAELEAK